MRHLLLVAVALGGCKYLDQPTKVAELEKRLDRVAEQVAALEGEGAGEDEDEDEANDEANDEDEDASEAPARKRAARDKAAPRGKSKARARDRKTPPAAEEVATPIEAPPGLRWGYDGATGPSAWASLHEAFAPCGEGTRQSPIDILPRPSRSPELVFVYQPTAATVRDSGHTLEVELAAGSFIVVDSTRYDLVQFHLHTPAEHTIAGDSFPMELHLVHRSKAGALAMVAVLYTEGEASTALAPLWKAAPKAGAQARLRPFDPDALLPKDRAAYRYQGSLTEPPCSEGVIWHVLRRPRSEDDGLIAGFRRRFGANARPVQELGDREVE